jgi:F-type H+-transporting ATPase subunit gamma
MAGTKEIKRRIKSVKNTKKITKAMELVAASKMKRAVASTLASRLYAEYSWEILISIAKSAEEMNHPLFTEKDDKNLSGKMLVILITSNRGLCGAYNTQVIKKALQIFKNQNIKVEVATIGRKGDLSMRRINIPVVASFEHLDTNVTLSKIIPTSKFAIDEYRAGHYDKILVAYTDFVSPLVQRANIKQILPVSRTDLKNLIESLEHIEHHTGEDLINKKTDYLFEGDKEKLISSLAEKLTRMQIYQMVTESNASEQSARMVAMKNASEASGEMIDDLTLMFNKARQANITREISEISAGMASVNS